MTCKTNCKTCEHKQYPDGGWCYMFRTEPEGVCKQWRLMRVLHKELIALLVA